MSTVLRKFFNHLACLGLITADRLAASFSKKQKKGVALVRLDAIGDFVLWSHTAAEYRKQYKSEWIVLIANAIWADLALQLPYWDEVWPIDVERFNKKLFYRWRTIHKISRAGFITAIQPTYSRIMLKGDSVIRATCAKHKIGSIGDTSNMVMERKVIADKWFTQLLPSSSGLLTELERNMEFVNQLFHTSLTLGLQLFPPVAVQRQVWHENIHKEYLILFPGASRSLRQWPARRFARVAEILYRQYGWQSLVCGSADERELCQQVCDQMEVEALNLAGKTSLPSFLELVRGARLLIANETSAIHIAAAVGTPAVCITGGGHYGRFVPYSPAIKNSVLLTAMHEMPCFHCNWECIHSYELNGPVPCIERITEKNVLDLVAKIQANAIVAA